jgi:hypothetical protein
MGFLTHLDTFGAYSLNPKNSPPSLLPHSNNFGGSNSLGFPHWRGTFASPGWVPQKAHNAAQRGCAKVSEKELPNGSRRVEWEGISATARLAVPMQSLNTGLYEILHRQENRGLKMNKPRYCDNGVCRELQG